MFAIFVQHKIIYMKKCCLLFVLQLLSLFLLAQTKENNYLFVSGSELGILSENTRLMFAGTKENETSTFRVSLQPGFGMFLLNDLAVGLKIPIQYTENKDSDVRETQLFYGLSPFFRYYFGWDNLKPYVDVEFSYSTIALKIENLYAEGNAQFRGLNFGGGLGLVYFFNKHVGLDTQIKYTWGNLSFTGDTDYKYEISDVQFLMGFSVFLGDD